MSSGNEIERPGAFGIPGATWSQTGLDLPVGLSYEDWEAVGWALGRIFDRARWGLGEWLTYGEMSFGERFVQALAATNRSEITLLEYGRVARNVPRCNRRENLSFSHHQLVAALHPDEQARWLDRAEASGWTTQVFREMLRATPALPTTREPAVLTSDAGPGGAVEALELVTEDQHQALLTRHADDRSGVEVRELVEDVARVVLRGAEPLGDGFARIPVGLLDRLASALGESR